MSAAAVEEIPELFTPEEVAERFRGHIGAYEIRRMAREGRIDVVRGPRNRILLTAAQANDLVEKLTSRRKAGKIPAAAAAPEARLGFKTSARSQRR